MEGTLRTYDALGRGLGSQVESDPPPLTPYEEVYRAGAVSLRHYRPEVRRFATPVVIVYALIKRPFILDLQPDKSVVRSLLSQGFEVYLIDWIPPGAGDEWRGFDAYVNQELVNAIRAVQSEEGVEQVNLIGYCFGALLSLLYTALHGADVANLVTLTIPFDMGTRELSFYHLMDGMSDSIIDLIIQIYGNCPAWLMNMGFTAMAPVHHAIDKYVGRYRNAEREGYAEMFELFERWMQSDVPLAGRIFKELTHDIFKRNLLVKGGFKIGDRRVDLGAIDCPLLNVVAEHDDVVHPSSSISLVDKVGSADKRTLMFPTGHLGAVVSAGAMKKLWPAIGSWIAERTDKDPQGCN
jgi:polyhydroxyalkanoate synthase